MKKISLSSLITLCLVALFCSNMFAQNEESNTAKATKKVVIIKKTVDKDGNETVEKIIREGNNVEDVIEYIDTDDATLKDIDIEVICENKDGTGDKQVKVMILEDENLESFPDDIKEQLKDINVNVNSINGKRIIKIDKDGKQILNWTGEGELPAEIKDILDKNGVKLHMLNGEESNTFHFYKDQDVHIYDLKDKKNNACLGVVISKSVSNENGVETVEGVSKNGVVIQEIIKESSAEQVGLQEDDVITAINGKTVVDIDDVINELHQFKAGDQVAIAYERNNKPQEVTASLKACKTNFPSKLQKKIIIKKEMKEEKKDKKAKRKKDKLNVSPKINMDDNFLRLDEIVIFPNPSNGIVNLNFRGEAVATTVKIVDVTGKEVYRDELNQFDGVYNNQIDISDAAAGTLLISVSQGDKQFTQKVIYNKN